MSFKTTMTRACAFFAGAALLAVSAVSANASTYRPEGQVTLADTAINEATLSVLRDYGFQLDVTPGAGQSVNLDVTVDRDRAAEVYAENAPHWNASDDTEGEAGLSLRVMSSYNHDEGMYQSPYQAGDYADQAGFLSVVDGEYVNNGRSITNSLDPTQRVFAHTSWREGGVPNEHNGAVPLETWAHDDFATVPGADFTRAREAAGAYAHNPATLSDATTGTTTIVVQGFAIKGELNDDAWETDPEGVAEANQHNALALTDGLVIVLDTSDVTWAEAPVHQDGWAYQVEPNGYIPNIPGSGTKGVKLLEERVEDNVRYRSSHTDLWHNPEQTLDLHHESIADWQPAPTPVMEENTEVTVGFFANDDGTYGAFLYGDELDGGFHLPLDYTQEDDGSYRLVMAADDAAYIEAGSWASDNGQFVIEWEAAEADNGELVLVLHTDAPLAPAQGFDVEIEEEVITATHASYGMSVTSFSSTYNLPWANDDFATTVENNPVDIEVFNNDGSGAADRNFLPADVFRLDERNSFTQASNGTVEPFYIESESNGERENWRYGYTYSPDNGFHGEDSFTYTWIGDEGEEVTATVFITVEPLGAINDAETTQMGQPVRIDILSNDNWVSEGFDFAAWFAANPNHQFAVTFTEPANGSVELVSLSYDEWMAAGQGSPFYALYTPNEGFHGEDTFSYTWVNPEGVERGADVVVTIAPGDTPEVPETPDTPEVPEVPVITPPDTPEVPDVPGRSDTGLVADLTADTQVEDQEEAQGRVEAVAPANTLNPAGLWAIAAGLLLAGAFGFFRSGRALPVVRGSGRHQA